jgi:hypothetical protein
LKRENANCERRALFGEDYGQTHVGFAGKAMATRLAVQHVANRGKVATEREAVNVFARPWLPQLTHC